jgi:hypothetical protein
MRFCQIIETSFRQLKERNSKTVVVVTCEKEEMLGNLSHLLFKHKVIMKSPEREDRQQIINFCLNNKLININAPELAKFL